MTIRGYRPSPSQSFWFASFFAIVALTLSVINLLGCTTPFFSNVYITDISSGSSLNTRIGYFGACTRYANSSLTCGTALNNPASASIFASTNTTSPPPATLSFTNHLQTHILTYTILAGTCSFALSFLILILYRGLIYCFPSANSNSTSIVNGGTFSASCILLTTFFAFLLTWISASMSQQSMSTLRFAAVSRYNPSSRLVFRAGINVMALQWAACVLVTLYAGAVVRNLVHIEWKPAEEELRTDLKPMWQRDDFHGAF